MGVNRLDDALEDLFNSIATELERDLHNSTDDGLDSKAPNNDALRALFMSRTHMVEANE